MNKADYIHLFKEACGGRCNAEYNPCAYRQAANSLAALKPVAWHYKNMIDSYLTFDKTSAANGTPLYTLNEVNNENAPLPQTVLVFPRTRRVY